jgi:hypothetical protein
MPFKTRPTVSIAKRATHPALAEKARDSVFVKKFRQELCLTRKQFARLIGASGRAVAGWESDRPLSPVVQMSLRELEPLCRALIKIMKSKYVRQWLDTPNNAFSGLKPLDLIEHGELDRLWRMVFEVESGALG